MRKTRHTVLLGAFDRYNYGDILFPVILEKKIREVHSENNMKLTFCGLKETNLINLGGYKTASISNTLQKEKIDNIIIVGGDVLGASMAIMKSNISEGLQKHFRYNIYYMLRKFNFTYGTKLLDSIAGKLMNIKRDSPRIPNEENINVLYNAVGGELLAYTENEYLLCNKHLSVRDHRTRSSIKEGLGYEANLSPDSAGIMSDIFPIKLLEKKINKTLRNWINKNSNYLVFQCNIHIGSKYYNQIIDQIVKVHSKIKYHFFLLPIGYASKHEDDKILIKIKNELDKKGIPCFLPTDVQNIYEIMYTIGKSNLYVGTSLHGAITGISYGKPVIGLSKEIKKLDSYLKTRGGSIYQDGSTDIGNIANKILEVLKVDNKLLDSISNTIKSKINKDMSYLIDKL